MPTYTFGQKKQSPTVDELIEKRAYAAAEVRLLRELRTYQDAKDASGATAVSNKLVGLYKTMSDSLAKEGTESLEKDNLGEAANKYVKAAEAAKKYNAAGRAKTLYSKARRLFEQAEKQSSAKSRVGKRTIGLHTPDRERSAELEKFAKYSHGRHDYGGAASEYESAAKMAKSAGEKERSESLSQTAKGMKARAGRVNFNEAKANARIAAGLEKKGDYSAALKSYGTALTQYRKAGEPDLVEATENKIGILRTKLEAKKKSA